MKQTGKQLISLFLAAITLSAFTGCKTPPLDLSTPDVSLEDRDEKRVQLYVYNSDFGFGREWLNGVKEDFELAHAGDTCWENGKEGVQVIIRNDAEEFMPLTESVESFLSAQEEVYFVQNADYRALQKKGVLADLTELVFTPLAGESRSIAEKISPAQQPYYFVLSAEDGASESAAGRTAGGAADVTSGAGSYYAVPHQLGFFGLVYNVELFEQRGYYFSATLDEAGGSRLIATPEEDRSAGPDGESGTLDDGLPATYQEFFYLCQQIALQGDIPVLWGGEKYESYLSYLLDGLAAEYVGSQQTMLRYTLSGTATELGSIKNGSFVLDETDTLITEENGYELARSAGNFYALEFIKRLVGADFCEESAFTRTYRQADAQAAFIQPIEESLSPHALPNEIHNVAMLADGSWWESGATEAFAKTAQGEESATENEVAAVAKNSRRFGWMPLPKANEKKVGTTPTALECLGSFAFIKSNVAKEKLVLAEAFLRFAFSDEQLAQYTRLTGTEHALGCPSAEAKAELSYFGKSLQTALSHADVVYPYAMTDVYLNNERFFHVSEIWRASYSVAAPDRYPALAFVKNNTSVVDYFNGMLKYRQEGWQNLKGLRGEK